MQHEFYLVALFQMRMAAAQKKAITQAEKVRKVLVDNIRKERKYKMCKKAEQEDGAVKVEESADPAEEKSVEKKHKHKK